MSPTVREQLEIGDLRRGRCLRAMEALNRAFKPMLETTCAYRVELGAALRRLVECYNSLFLQLLHVSYSTKNIVAGHNEYERKIVEYDEKLLQFEAKQNDFQESTKA